MKDFLIARRLSVAEIPTVAGETQTSLLSSVKISHNFVKNGGMGSRAEGGDGGASREREVQHDPLSDVGRLQKYL